MDRLLSAMDYPYPYVLDEVTESDALPFSDAEKKQFFQSNAERLFRLAPSGAAG
jgi:2,3-dihydroxybenzoate decarboxylase